MDIFQIVLAMIGLIFIAYLILVMAQVWPLILIAIGLVGVIKMLNNKR